MQFVILFLAIFSVDDSLIRRRQSIRLSSNAQLRGNRGGIDGKQKPLMSGVGGNGVHLLQLGPSLKGRSNEEIFSWLPGPL